MSSVAQKPLSERTDSELIEEGRMLARTIERTQLRLGQLARAFAPMGEAGRQTGAMGRTEMVAESIGAEPNTLKRYRATAHAWSQFDISDNEFTYSLLEQLSAVVDKE